MLNLDHGQDVVAGVEQRDVGNASGRKPIFQLHLSGSWRQCLPLFLTTDITPSEQSYLWGAAFRIANDCCEHGVLRSNVQPPLANQTAGLRRPIVREMGYLDLAPP
jgi:hypothetical protein